jgi:hypothetical protein
MRARTLTRAFTVTGISPPGQKKGEKKGKPEGLP